MRFAILSLVGFALLPLATYAEGTLDEIVVTAQAKPDYKPTVEYHVPEAGDAVPDFKRFS